MRDLPAASCAVGLDSVATHVALVSCVRKKRDVPAPARNLYVSALFQAYRDYAQTHADQWYILSAEHGVVHPDRVVAPYDRTLNTMSRPELLKWTERVQSQLLDLLPPGARVTLLAGSRYRQGIEQFLRKRGFNVEVPLKHLRIGEQLHQLKEWQKSEFNPGRR